MNKDTTTSAPKVGSSAVVLPRCEHEHCNCGGSEMQLNGLRFVCDNGSTLECHADEYPEYYDAPQAVAIVKRLAEWSKKYPRQQIHSFSAKVDEQLIEIENAAKAWLDGQNDQGHEPVPRKEPTHGN